MASVELVMSRKRVRQQTVLQPLDLTIRTAALPCWWALPAVAKSTLLRPGRSGNAFRRHHSDEPAVGQRSGIPPTAMWRWFSELCALPHPDGGGKSRLSYAGEKVDKQLQKSKVQQVASLLGIDKLLARYRVRSPAASASGWRWARAMVRNPRVFCSMSRCRTLTLSCGWSYARDQSPAPAHPIPP